MTVDFDINGALRAAIEAGDIVVDPTLRGRPKHIAAGALDDFMEHGRSLIQWRSSSLPGVNTLPATARLLVHHREGFCVLTPPPVGSAMRRASLWAGGLRPADIIRWARLA
jgi:hypothetical protein